MLEGVSGQGKKRDAQDAIGEAGEAKRWKPDSIRNDSDRKEATQKALDVLLEPNKRGQTPREQKVYQQSLEEVKRLNTGDYAINAQNDEELALYAARRAHLKALTFPGEFPDKQKNDWKPGGKWAQCAKSAEKYEYQVSRAERKRQQLEKECPIPTLNKAITELKNAISTYEEESQQAQRKYCKKLKAKLGTIRDYLEGKQIGIAKADDAWDDIKDEQKKQEFIAIVDLRQLLNLPHQETTSSFPDQGSHALKIPETVPSYQLQDVEMKSPDYDLTQQHLEQFLRHAEDMLKALPDNDFKTTSQARYNALITTYTPMTPDTATLSQLQDVSTQMTELHKDLIQRDVETIQAWFQKIRPNIDKEKYAEFEKLVQEHKAMPYEDNIPRNQQQMVNLHDRMMHFYQQQAADLFENAQLYVKDILQTFSKDQFLGARQEKYDALMKIKLREVSSYQLQDTLDKMIVLHHDVTQWNFQTSKAKIEILLDLTQQNDLIEDHLKPEFRRQKSMWNKLEEELNNSVYLDRELAIIDELLKVENSLTQIFYTQQTKVSHDLLQSFNSSEFKEQFMDLEPERNVLEFKWNAKESAWGTLSMHEEQRNTLDKGYTILEDLLKYQHGLITTVYEQTQSCIDELLKALPKEAFKQSQTEYNLIIEKYRPLTYVDIETSQYVEIDALALQESTSNAQTRRKVVADLLDFHSDLAQEVIKQTYTSTQQLRQLFQIEPSKEFTEQTDSYGDLINSCINDLFSPNTIFEERSIGNWQKHEKNAEADAYEWHRVVKGLLHFHQELTNMIYEQTQREVLPLITKMQDSSEKRRYQEDFDAQQTEYKESTNSGQKQLVLQRMKDLYNNLLPLDFQQHHSYIQNLLHHHIKDPQRKTEYQTLLNALQESYQTSLNLDRQRWQQGQHEIRALRSNVIDQAWKEDFQQLQAKIGHLLQGLQDDVVEGQYRNTYAQLQQGYEQLSQGDQKLGLSGTLHCYKEMALFHRDLLGVSEMNRQKYELKDDTKEMEHYAKDLEETLQRHMGRAHRVWSENEQGQSITYAHFTDPEGNKHLKEKVEVVNGTNTKTHEAVQGYYCPKTQHFISLDLQTVHDAQLIDEGQQLKLKDTRETPWEQQLRQWSKPADTQARQALEGAKQKIWKVLRRDDSLPLLELSLGFHGSYLSKTTISGSDADIHVAFNNSPMNNPFHNDLPKYREKMNNALIEAFTKQHATIYETVTTINEKAFGTEVDVFPAFHYTSTEGHKGLISFTEGKDIVTHFLEQKRQNAQAKSESTVYQFRSMIRIIKYLRNTVLEERYRKPYVELEESQKRPSFIIEALVHNTPDEHFVDYTPEGEPRKHELADSLNRVLAYCIDHTATDEACQEWKEVDGIKYLFNFSENKPWEKELKGVKYTHSGKHNIPREQVHEFLKQLQEYIKTQQEGQFQSIQLSPPLEEAVGHGRRGT